MLRASTSPTREGTTAEPPFDLWANILPTATILQFLRWEIQAPILITSAYRDLDHNRASGGVENSTTFQALDLKSPGASPEQIRRVPGAVDGSLCPGG